MQYTMNDLREYFTIHPRAKCPHVSIEGAQLSDVYGRYSEAKQRAFNYCETLRRDFNGWNAGISSCNTFTFTYAFELEHPETGEIMQAIITPKYNHLYYL